MGGRSNRNWSGRALLERFHGCGSNASREFPRGKSKRRFPWSRRFERVPGNGKPARRASKTTKMDPLGVGRARRGAARRGARVASERTGGRGRELTTVGGRRCRLGESGQIEHSVGGKYCSKTSRAALAELLAHRRYFGLRFDDRLSRIELFFRYPRRNGEKRGERKKKNDKNARVSTKR